MNSSYRTWLTDTFDIEYPIIMAPMFLVSNTKMIVSALENGVTAAFPALNYRTEQELRSAIQEIKSKTSKAFGVNLIVNKSNIKLDYQLKACIEEGVSFIITSLGSPKDVIKQCHAVGIKVMCDVTDLAYAQKVESLGADAVVAVNSQAGGHCGKLQLNQLIPLLKNNLKIPVISAGGVSNNETFIAHLNAGADGVSVGTIFIASEEAEVSDEYKQALIDYGAKDIVLSEKLSGSPLTVINTPYVKQSGLKSNWLERFLLGNKWFKKLTKLFIFYKGMKKIEQAAKSHTYKTVWCAGPSIEDVKEVKSVKEIVKTLISNTI